MTLYKMDIKMDINPLLFIYYVGDQINSVVGDHPLFSDLSGFMSYEDFGSFFTDEMCKEFVAECKIPGVTYDEFIDEDKVYIIQKFFKRPAARGEKFRGTILLLRNLD